MPTVHEKLIRQFTCSLCPNTAEVSGPRNVLDPNPRFPEGWTWTVRPRADIASTAQSPRSICHTNPDCEPLIYLCRACTKRVEDAMTPHPDKRK